jgi:two-component system chemotaxis response regulator CheY
MKQILVVDDASTIRLYHRQVLVEGGFAVDEAINGLDALEKALSKRYDLMIVDVNMPKMDGYAFLREMRSRADMYQAPAVVVTTESKERDRYAALLAGANFYMAKPSKPDLLLCAAALMAGEAK